MSTRQDEEEKENPSICGILELKIEKAEIFTEVTKEKMVELVL